MTTANIYLTFNGNCEEAFNFYKSIIGNEFSYIGKFKDMPADENGKTFSGEEGEKIMHVSLPVSKETILMGSDTGAGWASNYKEGNNFTIALSTGSREEVVRLFNGLSEGGNVIMPLEKTFWSELYGMFTDKFGINWMVSLGDQPDSNI